MRHEVCSSDSPDFVMDKARLECGHMNKVNLCLCQGLQLWSKSELILIRPLLL